MYYVCMYVCTLFGALISALGDMDVSQVEYACIMNVGIDAPRVHTATDTHRITQRHTSTVAKHRINDITHV